MEKLGQLGLVLAAAQDAHPSPEVKKALRNLQNTAFQRCVEANTLTYVCRRYGDRIIGLVESLPLPSDEELLLDKIKYIPGQCEMIATDCDKAITEMIMLVEEIPATVHRITTAFNESK
jgi:predicted translin family RNA/ssDNA-binding protein